MEIKEALLNKLLDSFNNQKDWMTFFSSVVENCNFDLLNFVQKLLSLGSSFSPNSFCEFINYDVKSYAALKNAAYSLSSSLKFNGSGSSFDDTSFIHTPIYLVRSEDWWYYLEGASKFLRVNDILFDAQESTIHAILALNGDLIQIDEPLTYDISTTAIAVCHSFADSYAPASDEDLSSMSKIEVTTSSEKFVSIVKHAIPARTIMEIIRT